MKLKMEEITPEKMAKHQPPEVKYLNLGDRTLAYRYLEGRSPILIYVPGFLSTMEIHKATALEQYAQEHGQASIRYDQSSVGLSEGVDRTEANNDVWIRDTLAMMDIVADKEPVVLVSSSNGGQVSAYIAKIRTEQVKGLLMIGPSLEYKMKYMRNALDVGLVPKDDLAKLKAGEQLSFTTNYGKGYFSLASMALTEKYDLDMDKEIPITCPVRILHALEDEEVPWDYSRKFLENVQTESCDLILRKSGNHRLMKPRDLTLLIYTIHHLLKEIEAKHRPKL